MFRLIGVTIVLAIFLPGCAATKTTIGIDGPDFTKIKPGTQRIDAEKILGKRLWHVGVADGLNYDIYQFEAEQNADPMLGAIILGLDFISLGSFELELNDPLNFMRVKQVALAYDDQDRVAYVSNPWLLDKEVGPCRRQRYLLQLAGVTTKPRPEPLTGLALSSPSNAKLDMDIPWNEKIVASVDGHELEDSSVELPSGHHEVKVDYDGGRTDTATVELLPGRFYRLKLKKIYGYARMHPFYLIEDVNSGEVLHCVPP